MLGTIRFGDREVRVLAATFERFHLYSPRPNWVLDAHCEGSIPRLLISGTCEPAPYSSPRALALEYLDAPALVTLGERDGTLAIDRPNQLAAQDLGEGRVRVWGTLVLRWSARDRAPSDLPISVELNAALIT